MPEGAFVVPDPNLIFNGDFKRAGLDLVLSHEGHEHVVHDYFRGDKRAAIASPDGAHLTGDVVNALTGYVQYAQAAPGAAAALVIGHVTKLSGSATVVRNGVSVILNNGDNVEKGDVVSTGGDSTLGITFIDGTVFGLSSNARMVLNEMVYDPNGSSNSSLLSLVAGTITFVAGETAKHGDMKVDTPVATMGIRGTAVLTQIDFVVPAGGGDPQPQANFQVLVEPNGTTGSYILFDKVTLLPIATVNQAGQMIQISGGNVSITSGLLSPDVQKLITDVFTLKFTDNSSNTKLATNFTDTITQTSDGILIRTPGGNTVTVIFTNLNQPAPQTSGDQTAQVNRYPGKPLSQSLDLGGNVKTAFSLTERAGTTGDTSDDDTVSGRITFLDQNLGDRPTVSINLADAPNYVYKNAGQQDVTGSLTALQKQDIAATEIKINVVPDGGNTNSGSAVWTYSIPDHAFDFLAAGETLTLTYMVRVDNNFTLSPETTFIPITITITGTNDKPVITSSVPTITFAGGTSVPGGPLTSDVPTSGTLNFTDVDLTDTHSVSVKLTSASLPDGTVPPGPLALFQNAMSVAIASGGDSTGSGSGTVNWSLADLPVYLADFIPKDEVLTLVYTVTVTDSQGATAQQTITVTITGTDEPAVVWIATSKPGAPAGGFWKVAANWETGTVPTINDDVIVITDQLHGLTPSYPVTIDAAAFGKSLTMDDYDTTAHHTAPEVINQSTLTIAGTLTLNADAKFTNSAGGHVFVGGPIDVETITRKSGLVVTNTSTITNAGLLTLAAGGMIDTLTTIANSGVIDLSGGTLALKSNVANTGGTLKADAGTTLIVDSATVDGGSVNILGTLELDGVSLIENGTLTNSGTINVEGTAEFAHETVSNTSSGTISVLANGTLTIDPGTLHAITNQGVIEAVTGGTLKLTSATITNTGGSITVDGTSKLYLTGVSINGGSLSNAGNLYSVSGLNTVTGGVTNTGTIEVQAGTLNLSGGITGMGTLIVDDHATLELGGADAQTITFAGGANTLKLDETGHSFTGTITGQASTGGTFTVTGDADITATKGDALDFTASGGTSGSRGNVVLTPTGTLTGASNGIVVTQNGIGDISLTTAGDITGLNGKGIVLHDDANGAGNITATIGGGVSGAAGVEVVALGDGNVTITNNGHITGTTSFGINVDQDDSGATGSTHITNTGSVVGTDGFAAISVQESGSGTALIDNSGTIGPDDAGAATSTTYAIVEIGGTVTINNTGHINGNISVATATFNNEAGGTWTVSGTSVFGTLSTIDNAGTIDLHDGASISSADGLTFDITNSGGIESWGTTTITGAITNTGTIEIHDGVLTLFGKLSGSASASVIVDAGALLKLEGTVTQTIALAGDGAALQIDTSTFDGSIADLSANDTIDLSMIKYGTGTSAVYVANADPSTGGVLTVTDADGNHISLNLTGADYSNAHFAGSNDGTGHTLITFNADDDAPVHDTAAASLTASFAERENTTGSGAPDPVPTANGSVDFADIDLTDRPMATITSQCVTWLDADHTTQLTLTGQEQAALEQALTLQQVGKNNGTVSWSYSVADSALDFLGEGQTATVVSTITLDDHQGRKETAQVTVTITGTNDAPVITIASGDSAVANLTEANTGLDKTGTLTVSDADATDHVSVALDHVSVYLNGVLRADGIDGLTNADLLSYVAVPTGDILNGAATHAQFTWEFNSGSQAFDFLAAGQTLSLHYTIVPDDGHAASGTGDGVVTINIIGSNDAPTLDDTTLASVAGNDTDPRGSMLSDLFANKFHDADAGASLKAIAVTCDAASAAEGVWQYEVGSHWVDIGPIDNAHGLVLSPDTLIRFVPADGYCGTPGALGVHALDNTYAGAITTAGATATIDLTATGTSGTTPVSDKLTAISTDVTAPPAAGPVIDTASFHVEHVRENGSYIATDLHVIDTDPGAATDDFTVVASTAPPSESCVHLYPASGSLEDINMALENGAIYNPGHEPPAIEQVTLTVTDKTTGLFDTVHFIFSEAFDASRGITLQGTSGKDVIIATDTNDTLTGGGGKDQFVFAPGWIGHDAEHHLTDFSHTITDFTTGLDKIDLRLFSDVGSMNNLAIVQQPSSGDTLVTWQQQVTPPEGAPVTEHESLLLKNVIAAHVNASDFIFHIS